MFPHRILAPALGVVAAVALVLSSPAAFAATGGAAHHGTGAGASVRVVKACSACHT